MDNSEKFQGEFFLKSFFLKAVSVTMTANSEIMKIKKNPISFWSPSQIFLKNLSPTLFFEKSIFPFKKGVRWLRKLMFSFKNLCIIIY